ncbi:unnamed protein product [Dibothriocephalus latus]|uniref:EF-hand domain-containing protein n=1 Tax=Dibothriocephalus latus TaxID=60516 RepID=A0A3P7L767_DIBLA|nr:unnamed protein product [Dibothriocephalus latus]
MSDLPEKELQDARELFMLYTNGEDEKIEAKYIAEIVRALGLTPTEADLKKYQRITFETFLPIYQGLLKEKKPNNAEEFIEGFRVFDKEANGFISSAELRHLLTQLGERLRNEEVDVLLSGIEDSQGQVPYEGMYTKFVKLWRFRQHSRPKRYCSIA